MAFVAQVLPLTPPPCLFPGDGKLGYKGADGVVYGVGKTRAEAEATAAKSGYFGTLTSVAATERCKSLYRVLYPLM